MRCVGSLPVVGVTNKDLFCIESFIVSEWFLLNNCLLNPTSFAFFVCGVERWLLLRLWRVSAEGGCWGGGGGGGAGQALRILEQCVEMDVPSSQCLWYAVLREGGGRLRTVRREGAVRALCGASHSVSYLPPASAPVKGRGVVCLLCSDTIRFRDELAVGALIGEYGECGAGRGLSGALPPAALSWSKPHHVFRFWFPVWKGDCWAGMGVDALCISSDPRPSGKAKRLGHVPRGPRRCCLSPCWPHWLGTRESVVGGTVGALSVSDSLQNESSVIKYRRERGLP